MANGNTQQQLGAELKLLASGEPPAPSTNGEKDQRAQYAFARWVAQNDYYFGFYQTWTKTVLFLLGRHWLKWLEGARRYTADTDVPPWRQQPVTNLVYAIYRTIAAKMTKQRPTLEVVPPSGDADDRDAAGLGQSILEHLWRALKTPQKLRRGLGWYLCTGQVFLRVHWDPNAGKMVPLTQLMQTRKAPDGDQDNAAGEASDLGMSQTDAPMEDDSEDRACPCDKDGNPILNDDGTPNFDAKPAMVAQGEIALDYEDPMSVRYNPDALDDEDADEMYVGRLWPKAQAARHFQLSQDDFGSGDAEERQYYEDLVAAGASGAGFITAQNMWASSLGSDRSEAIGDRCLVLEYYRRPDPQYPEGRHWISVGPKKVWPKDDDAEYPNGEAPLPNGFWPPLIPVTALPIPGQPQAMGALAQVVPLNEQLNTLDGKIAEYEVTMSMGGKWVKDPSDNNMTIDSDPAQVLNSKGYAQGRPPFQVKLQALPGEIYNERNVLMDKVRTVMALSEADLGKRPEGVSAGRAFLVLQEVTDSVLGPDLDAWAQAIEELGRRELVLAQRYYREERTIAIRGEKGKYEIRSFQGADLKDGLDVRVQSASMFPWSKSAQLDMKLSILSEFQGLVADPQTGAVDQEKLAKFLDAGPSGLDAFTSDGDSDLVEVDREHAMFAAFNPAKGELQIPQLGFWQSHAKHLEAHYDFLKRNRGQFDRWTKEAQQAFLVHCQVTAQAVDELAGRMLDATGGGASATIQEEDGGAGMAPTDAPMMGGEGQSDPQGMGMGEGMEQPMLQDADFAEGDGEPMNMGMSQ